MNKVIRRVIGLIPAVLIQLLWLYALMRWLSPYAALINLLLPAAEGTTPETVSGLGGQNPRLAQTLQYVEKKTGLLCCSSTEAA